MNTDEESHLLCAADFPSFFVNCAHPGDYVPLEEALPPQVIVHRKAHHNRLFLRICFRANDGTFVPVTFILDTGSPSSLYVGELARSALDAAGRLVSDEADTEFIDFGAPLGKANVQDIPAPHAPANIMGLPLLLKLGLRLDATPPSIRGDVAFFA